MGLRSNVCHVRKSFGIKKPIQGVFWRETIFVCKLKRSTS
jgi:hypothetical protein